MPKIRSFPSVKYFSPLLWQTFDQLAEHGDFHLEFHSNVGARLFQMSWNN
jgi:hypothetical protein